MLKTPFELIGLILPLLLPHRSNQQVQLLCTAVLQTITAGLWWSIIFPNSHWRVITLWWSVCTFRKVRKWKWIRVDRYMADKTAVQWPLQSQVGHVNVVRLFFAAALKFPGLKHVMSSSVNVHIQMCLTRWSLCQTSCDMTLGFDTTDCTLIPDMSQLADSHHLHILNRRMMI